MTVLLFEQEQLLYASINVDAAIVPAVSWIVLIGVGPRVSQESVLRG